MAERRRFKHTASLEERLGEDTEQLREQAKALPPGAALDHVLRRIRQNETAAHMTEWLSWPGLKPPPKGKAASVGGLFHDQQAPVQDQC